MNSWAYSRQFTLTQAQAQSAQGVELVIQGIDTVATISVNSVVVASVDNMFVSFVVPIPKALLFLDSPNNISVDIASPVVTAKARSDAYPYPVYPESKSPTEHGFNLVQFIRKEQCSFGWDWAIAIASSGIWQGLSLRGFDSPNAGTITRAATIPVPAPEPAWWTAFAAKSVNAAHADWAWRASTPRRAADAREAGSAVTALDVAPSGWNVPVNACVTFAPGEESAVTTTGTVTASIDVSTPAWQSGSPDSPSGSPAWQSRSPDSIVSGSAEVTGASGSSACVSIALHVESSPELQLWWPNGYGERALYNITITYSPQGMTATQSTTLQTGFRRLEMVQKPIDDAIGWTYYFEVNGAPVFAKGANWVPPSGLPTHITSTVTDNLLQSASAAHMTMLRVWGGGIYNPDSFYSQADRLGILLWQEAQLGDSLYPTNDEFLGSLAEEIQQQMSRLSSHPSVAIMVGSNEDEEAIANGYNNIKANATIYKRYVDDYLALTYGTIGGNYSAVDGSRYYSGSSPSDGVWTEMHGGIAPDPCNWTCGSTHYSNLFDAGLSADPRAADAASSPSSLTLDCWNPIYYPTPRYASEYGYFSWPSALGMASVTEPEDRVFNSTFLAYRNHHPDGNQRMLEEMALHYPVPHLADAAEQWKLMLWMTQIVHSECIQRETNHYRRYRSVLDKDTSFGLTMGATYWQLDDEWPTASVSAQPASVPFVLRRTWRQPDRASPVKARLLCRASAVACTGTVLCMLWLPVLPWVLWRLGCCGALGAVAP
jgi:beta-galactosidase/beta-glucuronidase